MKKSVVIVLLLALYLCSCEINPPYEIIQNTPTPKIVAAEPSPLVEATSASIEFMDETITAPSSYPGVPEQYIPVLDNFYLKNELEYKYRNKIINEGFSQDASDDYRAAFDSIKEHMVTEYLPGNINLAGYALVDLNGDDSPELLLLDNSPYYYSIYAPSIYSIFSIENGELVCIITGSFILYDHTFLSPEGIFYECTNFHTGFVDLKAYRLIGSKLVTITETYASLNFDDGNIPVPYWSIIKNGEEASLTENEFNMIYEYYKNPIEKMELSFIPISPELGDLTSLNESFYDSYEEKPTIDVEYPQFYEGAPDAYKPILDDFYYAYQVEQKGLSIHNAWGTTKINERPYGELSYAIADLNCDGVLELLLGSDYELNEASPSSVFTLVDDKPVLLDFYWSRSRCTIAADGTFYCIGSSGAAYTHLNMYIFEKFADSLTHVTRISSDYFDAKNYDYYYLQISDTVRYMDRDEFLTHFDLYYKPPEIFQLSPIPIGTQ